MIQDGSADDMHPNTFMYTYVIDVYARLPNSKAPHLVQRLIEEMERLHSEGNPEVRPTTRTWNSVIAAWAQWKGKEIVSLSVLHYYLQYVFLEFSQPPPACFYQLIIQRHGDILGRGPNVLRPVWISCRN